MPARAENNRYLFICQLFARNLPSSMQPQLRRAFISIALPEPDALLRAFDCLLSAWHMATLS